MVAITVAIAATVYVYVSGMIGGTKTQTPNVACTVDSTANTITVATADASIKWSDVVITSDITATKVIWYGGGATSNAVTPMPAGTTILAGDYIIVSAATGNVQVTLRYTPTNSLLGSWTVNV